MRSALVVDVLEHDEFLVTRSGSVQLPDADVEIFLFAYLSIFALAEVAELARFAIRECTGP